MRIRCLLSFALCCLATGCVSVQSPGGSVWQRMQGSADADCCEESDDREASRLQRILSRSGNRPKKERRPKLKKIADPENLESDVPAIKVAAKIKQAEDLGDQKVKAIKYLLSLCCDCYDDDGEVTDAIIASLDDPTEDVRFATIHAIYSQISESRQQGNCNQCGKDCCKEKIVKKLAEIAFEMGDDGCPLESSKRVRDGASQVLQLCCPPNAQSMYMAPMYDMGTQPSTQPYDVPQPPLPPGIQIEGPTSEGYNFEGSNPNRRPVQPEGSTTYRTGVPVRTASMPKVLNRHQPTMAVQLGYAPAIPARDQYMSSGRATVPTGPAAAAVPVPVAIPTPRPVRVNYPARHVSIPTPQPQYPQVALRPRPASNGVSAQAHGAVIGVNPAQGTAVVQTHPTSTVSIGATVVLTHREQMGRVKTVGTGTVIQSQPGQCMIRPNGTLSASQIAVHDSVILR